MKEGTAAALATSGAGLLGNLQEVSSTSGGAGDISAYAQYSSYVQLSKADSGALLHVLDILSRLASSLMARNVQFYADAEFVYVLYDNTAYHLVWRFTNISGKEMGKFCVPINQLKRLFGSVQAQLVLVGLTEGEVSGYGAGLYGCFSGNLVLLETVPSAPDMFAFEQDVCEEAMDSGRLRTELGEFTSLLSLSERPSERQLITHDGYSYFNIGSILGRTPSFFGNHSCIVSRNLVECITTMAGATDGDIMAHFADDHMSLVFGDKHYLRFSYTTGDMVQRFMTPLFKRSFQYEGCVHVEDNAFRELLGVVSVLDNYTDTVKLSFGKESFTVVVHLKDGKDQSYNFVYESGSSSQGDLVVPISVVLGVLGQATATTQYSYTQNALVVDLGSAVYCIRSVLA